MGVVGCEQNIGAVAGGDRQGKMRDVEIGVSHRARRPQLPFDLAFVIRHGVIMAWKSGERQAPMERRLQFAPGFTST